MAAGTGTTKRASARTTGRKNRMRLFESLHGRSPVRAGFLGFALRGIVSLPGEKMGLSGYIN
jgi:hypothetical protein